MNIFLCTFRFSVYKSATPYRDARKISDGFQGLPDGISNIDAAYFDKHANKLYLFKGNLDTIIYKFFENNDT